MRNDFKLILRNHLRRPTITIINLFGLSVSMALVIILFVYSSNEFSTDKFHRNADRLYLLKNSEDGICTPGILKDVLDASVPEIEKTIRLSLSFEPPVFQFINKEPIVSDLLFSDEAFFDLFTYSFKEGSAENALSSPMSLVISSGLAQKLFGSKQALGKTIKLNNKYNLTISAVVNEQPSSCLHFSALASMETRKKVEPNEGDFYLWTWNNFQTYVLLKENYRSDEVVEKIKKLIPDDFRKRYMDALLFPFTDIYFSDITSWDYDYFKIGNKTRVMIIASVAALVLLVAVFNFINTTIAQKNEKIKQTEILKVVGARTVQLLKNSLLETVFLFLFALGLAYFLILLPAPHIFDYVGIKFDFSPLLSFDYLFVIVVSAIVLGLICGIFPALQLKKTKWFPGRKYGKTSRKKNSHRAGLVAFQFIVAIVLLGFTILVQKQVDFVSSDLGFKQTNIIGLKVTPQLKEKTDVLKNRLIQQVFVKNVSFSGFFPRKGFSNWGSTVVTGGEEKRVEFDTFSADSGLFEIAGLEIVRGKIFPDNHRSKEKKAIVNEQFVRKYNVQEPIGAQLKVNGGYEIVGVVKDFHIRPLGWPIEPLVIRNDEEEFEMYCLIELHTANFASLKQTINQIKGIIDDLSPAFPTEVSFFDQAVENMYQSELQFRKTFLVFAICAIAISCFGIFALSLISCQRRIKEIGIRKVNGAKIPEILAMLNKDFIKWVLVAFAIACPIAYYAMSKWLENFAYKTTISWWIYALAGTITLVVAMITVSWQTWRAARRNPVEALRYE